MSDGPYKTLPRRPGWKRLSERADKTSYVMADVAAAVCPALAEDWRAEVTTHTAEAVRSILGADSGVLLFPDQAARDLAALRGTASSPMIGLLLDCATQALADGLRGDDAYASAVEATLRDRALCGSRQVEEHYRRRVHDERTDNVRSRLDAAINTAPITTLAREIAGLGRPGRLGKIPSKRVGIEEGPSL